MQGSFENIHCSTVVWQHVQSDSNPQCSSLFKSYLILCQVLDNFDALRAKKFCASFYSILVQSSYENTAEIVKIHYGTLKDIKDGIGRAILSGDPCTLSRAGKACLTFLKDSHLAPKDSLDKDSSNFAWETSHHVFRLVALILDLGLITYVGSHGSRFDMDYVGCDLSQMRIDFGLDAKLGFVCSLKSLACLNDFLDHDRVWVFQAWSPKDKSGGLSNIALSILTYIEEFADLWGPVWEMSEGDRIWQYNVSKGIIRAVHTTTELRLANITMCHWYSVDSMSQRQIPRAAGDGLFIERVSRLLIGSLPDTFKQNSACQYTCQDLERDYGLHMTPLGTQPSAWEWKERSIGFSAGQYIGLSGAGVQKKRPKTTVKQNIWDKWNNKPERANPRIFDECLGIEVSNCTGNAKRIRLRDLFLINSVQQALDCRVPGWMSTDYGLQFLDALRQSNDGAVVSLCKTHPQYKLNIAELLCCVLDTLDKTGVSGMQLIAAFISGDREYAMPLELQYNNWGNLFRDSYLTAAYVIVNEICFEYHAPSYSTGICRSFNAYTVLQTQVALAPEKMPHEPICLGEQGSLNIVDGKDDNVLLVTWKEDSFKHNVLGLGKRFRQALDSQKPSKLSRELLDHGEIFGRRIHAFVRATKQSNGGLLVRRSKRSMRYMEDASQISSNTMNGNRTSQPLASAVPTLFTDI